MNIRPATIADIIAERNPSAQELADDLFERAMELEAGRPRDDISVVVLKVAERTSSDARRLVVRIPV